MIQYHKGNLFIEAEGKPKAHCISSDLAMGAGIAKEFVQRYGRPEKRNKGVGDCLVQIISGEEIIFHLITKNRARDKPTEETLTMALQSLCLILKENHISEIWMPRIASGLDCMNWEKQVIPILNKVFFEEEIKIHVVVRPLGK